MTPPTEERVLCCPRQLFDNLGSFQGLRLDAHRYFEVVAAPGNTTYIPRSEAENNPNWKQLIPYVLLVRGDEILVYNRSKEGGESRLYGKYSIGIGGHVCDVDKSERATTYLEGLYREIFEETGIACAPPNPNLDTPRAIINDDSSEVGKVHLGLVHVLRLPYSANTIVGDISVHKPTFVPIEAVHAFTGVFESWSQIVLGRIDDILKK